MVSFSAVNSEDYAGLIRALEERIRAANEGDPVVIGIVNLSEYRIYSYERTDRSDL